MNKKILVLLAVILIAILAIMAIATKQKRTQDSEAVKQEVLQKFQTFKIQFERLKIQGYDVSEAEKLGKEAKMFSERNDYQGTNDILDKAFDILEKLDQSCAQVITYAVFSSGECKSFPTPCDVPKDWTIVVDCSGTSISPVPVSTKKPEPSISASPISTLTPSSVSQNPWYYDGAMYVVTLRHYQPNSTFQELTKRVAGIKELGIKTIYLLPIWDSDPIYVYGVRDYSKLNSAYGKEADLKELIKTVHNNGMKIILDLVTGYVGEDSTVYQTHKDWLLHDTSGTIVKTWPHNFGLATDRANTQFISYFANDVAKYYVQEYDIDGWRADAPANLWNPDQVSGDHSSLELLRKTKESITSVKPDAILFTEHWGTKQDWGKYSNTIPDIDEVSEFSGGYVFRRWMLEAMISKNKTSLDLANYLKNENILYNRTRVRFLEDHNTERTITALSKQSLPREAVKPMAAMIFTIPGVPSIEAGQEIGETKGRQQGDPFPAVNWNNADYALRDFYIKISSIRNSHNALKYGGKESISNVWKSGDNIYAFSRTYGSETVVVAINFYDKQAESVLNIPFNKELRLTDELSGGTFIVADPDNFKISVPAYGVRILTVIK